MSHYHLNLKQTVSFSNLCQSNFLNFFNFSWALMLAAFQTTRKSRFSDLQLEKGHWDDSGVGVPTCKL